MVDAADPGTCRLTTLTRPKNVFRQEGSHLWVIHTHIFNIVLDILYTDYFNMTYVHI